MQQSHRAAALPATASSVANAVNASEKKSRKRSRSSEAKDGSVESSGAATRTNDVALIPKPREDAVARRVVARAPAYEIMLQRLIKHITAPIEKFFPCSPH